MAEKLFTARQAAEAVLKKTHELLQKHEHIGWGKLHGKLKREGYSEESADKIAGSVKAKIEKAGTTTMNPAMPMPPMMNSELKKYESQNQKKENAKPSEHNAKDADQHAEGKGPKGEIHPKEKEQAPPDKVEGQAAPEKNPKEQAEGNNELAGTTPTQVGEDGKNKPGLDEMKGHLKLAKFIGHMESKRKAKQGISNG